MSSKLYNLYLKKEKYVIGLMSGTSVDGIDAVLVKIKNNGIDTKVTEIGFETYPFDNKVREKIFNLFDEKKSSVREICYMNFLLGQLFGKAAINIAEKCNISINDIDLIGSHGQTIYHIPEGVSELGYNIKSTLQIGDGCVIADKTGVVTISDFRVSDMAAGGQGAPLVPYTEYILYNENSNMGFLNLGGIGNITLIPKEAKKDDIVAFDTGPGNMIIDFVVELLSNGDLKYDKNGEMAKKGVVCEKILNKLLEDKYFYKPLPKTTGREYFGKDFALEMIKICNEKNLSNFDIVATATAFTAKSVALAIKTYSRLQLNKLVISGGGSYNLTLVKMIEDYMKNVEVLTQEDLGLNSNSKEAVAFAVLANETISENESNLKSVTGANSYKVLGKISM